MKFDDILMRHFSCPVVTNEHRFPAYAKDQSFHYYTVDNSIHYNSLSEDQFDLYESYITESAQPEHSVSNFRSLQNNFDVDQLKKERIEVYWHSLLEKYVVYDGCHRISILRRMYDSDEFPDEYVLIVSEEEHKKANQIQAVLSSCVGRTHYNGWSNRTKNGYHSYDIDGVHVAGQRNPKKRVDNFRRHYNFRGKTVLDVGCNVGGMIHHLSEIKLGIGVDYDSSCISAANQISSILQRTNTHFYTHDCDRDRYDDLFENLVTEVPDAIFLLSVGSWIESWMELYERCIRLGSDIFLETNNDHEGREQLELFRKCGCELSLINENSVDDMTGNFGRKTYLISGRGVS